MTFEMERRLGLEPDLFWMEAMLTLPRDPWRALRFTSIPALIVTHSLGVPRAILVIESRVARVDVSGSNPMRGLGET
jgi:hypothetical protein